MRTAVLKADSLLLLAAAIWGTGFVAQRMGMDHVGPMTFNAVRFAVGACVLLPVIGLRRAARSQSRHTGGDNGRRVFLLGGGLAGTLLFIAAGLQQFGMVYTTAGKAGFITGLYVVIVPVLGLFGGHRAGVPTWVGACLAAAGLYFLSAHGAFKLRPGDGLILGCAFFWAVHVLVIGHFAGKTDPMQLAALQFAIVALLSAMFALFTEEISTENILSAGWAILYSGGLSVGVAFTLQVVAQRTAPPPHAAILLSLEAVFAAVSGWLLLGELLDRHQLLGCAMMLLGTLASQLQRSSDGGPG